MKKLLLVIGFLLATTSNYAAGGVSTATARCIVTFFSAPSSCVEGDKYYNLTSHSEFTCTSAGTWTATGGTTGANTALSNLASVAINTSILPGTNVALNLGSVSKGWLALWLSSSGVVTWPGGGINGYNQIQYTDGTGPVIYDDNAHSGAGASLTFNMQGLTADRTYTPFNGSGVLVLDTAVQTLTNKTLTDPVTNGTTPAVSNTTANSCGTSAATIVGNNTTGVVTVGAAAGTNCTITFTVAALTRRQCTVTNETTANLSRSTFLTTTTTTVEGTFAAGDKISYVCSVY